MRYHFDVKIIGFQQLSVEVKDNEDPQEKIQEELERFMKKSRITELRQKEIRYDILHIE